METKFTVNIKLPQQLEPRKAENIEQEMIDQANAFFQAGSRCDVDIRLSPNVTNSLSAPAVVCYAIAVEIYIKLLAHINGISIKKIHSLIELFDSLSDAVKEKIAKHYQSSSQELRKDIETVSNAFIDWRYLYEKNGAQISITMLSNLGMGLHNAIKELNPKLGITFENRLP